LLDEAATANGLGCVQPSEVDCNPTHKSLFNDTSRTVVLVCERIGHGDYLDGLVWDLHDAWAGHVQVYLLVLEGSQIGVLQPW